MSKFTMKVINLRKGGSKSLMGCDVAIGVENAEGGFDGFLELGPFWLMRSKAGALYYEAPYKFRTDKEGNFVEQNGYRVKDEYVRLFMTRGKDGKGTPAASAWEFRKQLIAEMEAAYETFSSGAAGRGASTPAPAVKPPTAKPKPAPKPVEALFDTPEEDDELFF